MSGRVALLNGAARFGGATALVAAAFVLVPSAQAQQAVAPAEANATAPDQATVAEVPRTGQKRVRTPGDPLEGFNRSMFSVYQSLDKAFFRPAALGYRDAVPRPVRSGLRNFLSNLGEPIVFLNDLLQLKPGRAAKTLTRFFVNSTLGIGGLIDVAKGENLPHRSNGLGNTLARYGVGPGPYIFLPFVGPSDVRDLLGGQVDGLVLPLGVGRPFDRTAFAVPRAVIGGLDIRAESEVSLHAILDGAVDPYATLRSVFQQNRAGEIAAIKAGTAPAAELDDPLADPEAPATPADPAETPPPAGGDDTASPQAPPNFYTP